MEFRERPKNSQAFDPIQRLVFELSKLPGIGERTAMRLTHHMLRQSRNEIVALAEALLQAKEEVAFCQSCFNFCFDRSTSLCRICSHTGRDSGLICVVERPADVTSMESAGTFRGVYHVLHGVLSPMGGVGPDQLKVRELLERMKGDQVREVILALNPTVEGEATSLYLSRLLKPIGIRMTQLAHGIPVGGSLEFTDRQTLGRAMENRMEMK
jgi:recombination protein RecR